MMPPTLSDIPLLNDVVPDTVDDLPLLTDVVGETALGKDTPDPFRLPGLQQALEAHIDSVFAEKLQAGLAAAQQQAVRQTLAELKNELPQLIHDALDRASADR